MGVSWTTEQQQVIDLRNRNILVSAAAGSGKTAVLVERIVKIITDKNHPVDIDHLLIVTFTNAAAAEMRERIGNAIEKALDEQPGNEHLLRQLTLIHNAQITTIGFDEYDLSMEDLIPRENTVITMTKLGYIKRMTVDNFRSQNRGGKGIKGMQTIEDDYIEELLMTTTHHYLMFFTNTGRVYRLKAYEIPEASRTARGTAIVNLLQLQPGW